MVDRLTGHLRTWPAAHGEWIRLRHRLAEAAFRCRQAAFPPFLEPVSVGKRLQRPGPSEARSLAARCRLILTNNLAAFFLRCVDADHGGYLEDARNGAFFDRGDKGLLMQARQLWFFCLLVRQDVSAEPARAAAHIGFDFLERHFRDRTHGGYFHRLHSDGRMLNSAKLVREQAFALYALTSFTEISCEPAARAAAEHLFDVLETRAYDRRHGGFANCGRADWTPLGDADVIPTRVCPGARSLDAEMHLLEALTDFACLSPSDRVRSRLAEMLLRCLVAFRHPSVPAMITHWLPPVNRPVDNRFNFRAHHGHDLELVWFALDAARCLGLRPDAIRTWAEQICDFTIRHGFDARYGGFYNVGSFSGFDAALLGREKLWWVQAEAMITMLEMYRLTGDTNYFEAFRRTFAFVETFFLAAEGGWWRRVTRRGEVSEPKETASATQGGYHSGRAMVRCSSLLEAIADAEESRSAGAGSLDERR